MSALIGAKAIILRNGQGVLLSVVARQEEETLRVVSVLEVDSGETWPASGIEGMDLDTRRIFDRVLRESLVEREARRIAALLVSHVRLAIEMGTPLEGMRTRLADIRSRILGTKRAA